VTRPLTTRAVLAGLAASAALVASAYGAATVSKRATRTATVAAGRTKTIYVPYPDALKYGGATYSGSVAILPPAAGAHGSAPSLAKVTISSRGEALGGSEYRVVVRNANASGTAPVRVRVTATTREPAKGG